MQLIIQLNHLENPGEIYELPCNFEETHFKNKWLARFYAAKERNDPISEPWSFYNLNDTWSDTYTLEFLNKQLSICNGLVPMLFNTRLTDINDQDTLNYLHSVFEQTHGKLDEWKTRTLFKKYGRKLRKALSNINQTIHRCEDSHNSKKIRVVYFDLPKTELYTHQDYKIFTTVVEFGGVYVHYTDVGKPIEELAIADDVYHQDIVPYLHYSVDFSIKFNDFDGIEQSQAEEQYKNDNRDMIADCGYEYGDPRLTSGSIKIAQLEYKSKHNTLTEISKYNNIHDVIIK